MYKPRRDEGGQNQPDEFHQPAPHFFNNGGGGGSYKATGTQYETCHHNPNLLSKVRPARRHVMLVEIGRAVKQTWGTPTAGDAGATLSFHCTVYMWGVVRVEECLVLYRYEGDTVWLYSDLLFGV